MPSRRSNSGLRDADAFFGELRPFRAKLLDASRTYRPSGPHYHMLQTIIAALDAAAVFFTGNRGFYMIGDSASIGRAPSSPSGGGDA